MADPRDVYNRSFRVVAHSGNNQVCIMIRGSDQKPWRRVYCFRTSEALRIADQVLDAVKQNVRPPQQT